MTKFLCAITIAKEDGLETRDITIDSNDNRPINQIIKDAFDPKLELINWFKNNYSRMIESLEQEEKMDFRLKMMEYLDEEISK